MNDGFPTNGGAPGSERAPLELDFRRMSGAERFEAFALLRPSVRDEAALGAALALFVDREDLGFVWLAFVNGHAVAAATVSYGISVACGAIAAQCDCFVVDEAARRNGIGRRTVVTLAEHLRSIDVGCFHLMAGGDAAAHRFAEALGFHKSGETRYEFVLRPPLEDGA